MATKRGIGSNTIWIPAIRCRFARYFSTEESDSVRRQEWQIVQSSLNLADLLPSFRGSGTPHGIHLTPGLAEVSPTLLS